MAGDSFTFSTANKYITGKIEWSSESNGSTANSSDVTVKLYYKKSKSATSATYGTLKGKLYINGKRYDYSKSITLSCNNTYKLVASKTVEIDHNNDGTKSIVIDATGAISGTSFTSSSCPATTIKLDTIPRYATTTIKSISVAQTSMTISWSASATLSALKVYVNGSLKNDVSVSSTSGNVTVSGLSPDTTYKVKLQGKRKDSGLWQYSSEKSATTKPIASISSSSINFTIGNDLKLTFSNYNIKAFYLQLKYLNSSNTWETILTTGTMTSSSYTWDLSAQASLLYSKIPKSNSASIRIYCCTETSTNKIKSNYVSGTMSINVSSNLPSTPVVSCENTGTSFNILGNISYVPTNFSGMTLKIKTLSVAKNSASISKYVSTVTNSSGTVVKNNTITNASSVPYSLSLGAFSSAGTYTLTLYAVDSRGNKSSSVTSSFTVLNYGNPKAIISLQRQNNFEELTFFNLDIQYSNLKISNISKNTNILVKYRYRAVGGSFGSYINIPLSSFTLTDNGISTSGKLATTIELSLDQKKSYDFEITISDSLTSNSPIVYPVLVGQGIPIMTQMDTGHVSVGMVPDLNSEALFQVGSDIVMQPDDSPISVLAHINNTNIHSYLGGKGLSTSGNRWDVIPYIGSDGVMEVGKYIDFHETDTDTSDYSGRLTANGDNLQWNGTNLSLNGHTHNTLYNSTAGETISFIKDGTYCYFRPDTASMVYCGSSARPWKKIYTEAIEVTANKPIFKYSYDNTVSYATNCHINSEGKLSRTTATSSKTIKHDICSIGQCNQISAEKLYDIDVVQFKYNEGVITDKTDSRYGKDLPGFIIEDLCEKYPIAVDKPSDNVKEWSWNAQYLIPPMLKLIQEQHSEIELLKKEIAEIKTNMS